MRKSMIIRIATIVAIAAITIGVVWILFLQQEKETSVQEDGGVSGVLINEAMSSNAGFLPDETGEFVDWIELYNPTDEDINLYGFGLSDDEVEPIKFSMPDITIKSKAYLIVFASDRGISSIEAPFIHTNFKLSSKGDVVILSNRAGQFLDRLEIEALPTNTSIGKKVGDPSVITRFENPTPGYANDNSGQNAFYESRRVKDPELIITEVMTGNKTTYTDNGGEYSDWIEIYNPSDKTVNLKDYYISDDEASPYSYRMPDVKIKSESYFLLYASGDIMKGAEKLDDGIHLPFKLSGYKENLILSNYQGMILDTVQIGEVPSDYSYMRMMSEQVYLEEWEISLLPSPGFINTQQGRDRFVSENEILLGDIIISEVVFSNFSYIPETDGEYYDWIELHNRGKETINIGGYGLTNNTGNPGKWRFPDMELKSGEYVIVQASGLGETKKTATELKKKYLNTNFSLSIDGEIIGLFNDVDQLIDRYNIASMLPNTSMGRQSGDNLLVFPTPTPGLMNTGGVTGYAVKPMIDTPFGVYDAPITVMLDVPNDSVCYYTVDGSVPTEASMAYESGITIDETTSLRAVSIKSKHMPSDVLTGTYFIGSDHTVDIISITTDPVYLWDNKKGIYALGDGVDPNDPRLMGTRYVDMGDGVSVFDYNTANDGNPDTENDRQQAMNAIVNANFRKIDFEVPANFSLYIDGKQVFEQNIGLQLFGSYSRNEVQKSFSIYARGKYGNALMKYPFFDTRDFTEYESVVARQSGQDCKFSRVKDVFITSLMEKGSDIGVQAYRQCVLYLNGTYWGIYNLREKSNKNFAAARHFAPNPQDNIDFLKGNGQVLTGSNADYKALEDFMDENDINIQANYDYVKSQMDVENFMDWLIAEVYFYNTDDGNRKFYRVRSDDGLWRWILFDMDWSMWTDNYAKNYIEEVLHERGTGAGSTFSTSIARGLMENDGWKRAFLERYAYLLETTFAPEVSIPHLSKLKGNIESEVEPECEAFEWVSTGFGRTVQTMEHFLLNRPAYAIENLQETLVVSDEDMKEIFGENYKQ
jgi:hypothetical protein